MLRLKLSSGSNLFFLAVLFLSFFVVLPLFHSGFFQSDDGEWMVIRFSAFHEAFRDGQIPVRFLGRLNHGYGYPVANFLYPGFMYLAEPIHLIGFSFVDTIKILFGLSLIGSGIFCYFWLRRLFPPIASFIGAIVYVYAPYHLFDIYKRGSLGEALALAIVPFILWNIERKSIFWSSIGIAFLILSHNTLALLFLPLIILYVFLDVIIAKGRKKLFYQYTSILVFGFGSSAFFWVPALFDLQYTVFSKTSVSNLNEYFADYSLVGISTFAILALALFLFISGRAKPPKHRLTVILLFIGVVSIFFATSVSNFLWSVLPVAFIQFPFRFLSVTILCFSFLAAFVISMLGKKAKIGVAIGIVLVTFFSARAFMAPALYFDKHDSFYATNEDTTTVKNEYMPKWVKKIPTEHYDEKVRITDGEISDLQVRTNLISFQAKADEPTNIFINTVYFPGWKVMVDSEDVSIDYTNDKGIISFPLQSGSHAVEAIFTETPVRIVSTAVSIVSFGLLIGWVIMKRKQKHAQ